MNFVSLQTSQIERRSMPAMGYITHTVSAPTLHGKTVRFSSFYRPCLSHYLTLLVWWINCALCIILSHNCWQNEKTPTLRLSYEWSDRKQRQTGNVCGGQENPRGFRQLEESSEMHNVSSFLHENRKKKKLLINLKAFGSCPLHNQASRPG